MDWTFGKLISDLAQPKALGDHDEATRTTLKGYADTIAERAKERLAVPTDLPIAGRCAWLSSRS